VFNLEFKQKKNILVKSLCTWTWVYDTSQFSNFSDFVVFCSFFHDGNAYLTLCIFCFLSIEVEYRVRCETVDLISRSNKCVCNAVVVVVIIVVSGGLEFRKVTIIRQHKQ